MPVCDVVTALRSERDEDTMADEEPPPDDGPQVVCTSFQGAKGLAAQHVFVVGMNDGHFPYRPSDPSELETCEFIVALTRGRRQCHLVSCGNFAGKWCDPSIFLQWVAPYTETITANKDYFA